MSNSENSRQHEYNYRLMCCSLVHTSEMNGIHDCHTDYISHRVVNFQQEILQFDLNQLLLIVQQQFSFSYTPTQCNSVLNKYHKADLLTKGLGLLCISSISHKLQKVTV